MQRRLARAAGISAHALYALGEDVGDYLQTFGRREIIALVPGGGVDEHGCFRRSGAEAVRAARRLASSECAFGPSRDEPMHSIYANGSESGGPRSEPCANPPGPLSERVREFERFGRASDRNRGG